MRGRETEGVCVSVGERESEGVCVSVGEREEYACVSVGGRERKERERGKEIIRSHLCI
jgi:hypothetical protein